jgi:hypothetical protein
VDVSKRRFLILEAAVPLDRDYADILANNGIEIRRDVGMGPDTRTRRREAAS